MNLRDLQYIVTLEETRHFGRAAQAACVSQPTLSSQIRKIEDMLGVQLFERNSRNVAPTPAGVAVVAEARAVLQHVDAIRDIAGIYRDPLAGVFRLGVIASLSPFMAPDLLDRLQYDAPRLDVVVHEGLTDQLLEALSAREIDAALIATETFDDTLEEVALFDEPFLLAHAPGHPLAKVARPSLGDIAAGNLLLLDEGHCLRDQALSICMADSVDARVKATSLLTLIRLAELNHGVTLVPQLAAGFAPHLVLRPIGDRHATRRVRLVTRRNFPRRGAAEVVAAAARAVAAQSGLLPALAA